MFFAIATRISFEAVHLLLQVFDIVWYGVTLDRWLIAGAVLGLVYMVLRLGHHVIATRIEKLASRTATDWDDMAARVLSGTKWYFLFLIAMHAAARSVSLPLELERVLRAASIIIVLIQIGAWGNALIQFGVDRYVTRGESDAGTRFAVRAIGYSVRFVLWTLLVITALQNFGLNITALVTGLGVGGIAIALAAQSILGDLFAAIAIVVDRPFVVGDFIIVGDMRGTVEHVGLKTTRIRSLSGEQLVVSNSELLKGWIHNYKRMQERRVAFNIDVTYDTPAEKVARIPGMVRSIVETQPVTRFDRSHFLSFADSSLRIETVYYVLDADYNTYADTQHAINVALLEQFAEEEIEFAFPSRTVYWRPATAGSASPYLEEAEGETNLSG